MPPYTHAHNLCHVHPTTLTSRPTPVTPPPVPTTPPPVPPCACSIRPPRARTNTHSLQLLHKHTHTHTHSDSHQQGHNTEGRVSAPRQAPSTTTNSMDKTAGGAGAHSHIGLDVVLVLVGVLAFTTTMLGIPSFEHKYERGPALGNRTSSSFAEGGVRTTYNARTDLCHY